MYPKKLTKSHVHSKLKNEGIKDMVLDKLIHEFGAQNRMNENMIKMYVDDFFTRQQLTEGALRALKQEIKNAVTKTKEEKIAIVNLLQQKITSRTPTQIQPKQPTQQQIEKTQTNMSTNNLLQQQQYLSRNTTEQEDKFGKKSIYQVEGVDDEWAAIVKYDTALYLKEQEEQKRLIQLNKQKQKEDLDKQLIEKEIKKKQQKEEEKNYAVENKYRAQEFNQQEEIRKELQKQKQMEEKQLRDQQVNQEKYKKKESQMMNKIEDQDNLRLIKEQMKQETDLYNQKRMEQKEKFQKMIKENEQLRSKAIEDLKMQKEYESKMQKLHLQQLVVEEEKREAIKREREEKIKQLMNNYSQNVLKNENDSQKKEDLALLENMRRQDESAKLQEEQKKQLKKINMEQIKQTLNEQIQDKKLRVSQEISESRKMIEKQLLENKLLKEREEQRINNKKLNYKLHAQELKSQMKEPKEINTRYQSTRVNKSMHEKMNNSELLQNKDILKKIANDQLITVPLKKNEIIISN